MKSFRNSFLSLAVVLLIGQTCAKDSEENLNEDESYVESMYGAKKEIVVDDWKKFLSLSKKMMAIAESNIKSLRVKANQSSGDQKIKWNLILQKSELKYQGLDERLQLRDLQFRDELNDYDGTSGKKNYDFKNEWLHEVVELNGTLEEAIDE